MLANSSSMSVGGAQGGVQFLEVIEEVLGCDFSIDVEVGKDLHNGSVAVSPRGVFQCLGEAVVHGFQELAFEDVSRVGVGCPDGMFSVVCFIRAIHGFGCGIEGMDNVGWFSRGDEGDAVNGVGDVVVMG